MKTTISFFLFACLALSGCNRQEPSRPQSSQPLPTAKSAGGASSTPRADATRQANGVSALKFVGELERLRLPEGISAFWRSHNSEGVRMEQVDQTLSIARKYEQLDQHKAYYYSAIPIVKFESAQTLSRNGKTEEAFALLEELRAKGFIPADQMSRFVEAVKNDPRFSKYKTFAETETDADAIGPYVVVKQPYFKLDDLRSLPVTPALNIPKEKVCVVFTGPSLEKGLGGLDEVLLSNLAKSPASVTAIVEQNPSSPIPGVEFYTANLPAGETLLVDNTRMLWIANKDGAVVYNLRLNVYYDPKEPLHVVEYLNSH